MNGLWIETVQVNAASLVQYWQYLVEFKVGNSLYTTELHYNLITQAPSLLPIITYSR